MTLPEKIGTYRVVRQLGEGMSGVVFECADDSLGRKVAVKVLRDELIFDPIERERFLNDARIMANADHPNIVKVHQLLEEGRRLSIVMELLPDTLEAKLARERTLPLKDALRLTGQAASALAAVHALGITHRDVKPANLMLAADGSIRVGDFSIARIQGAARGTRTGVAIGTAQYMAPEQLRGQAGDAKTDIYALACVLTEMLAGRPPFTGETPTDITHAHLRVTAPRLGTLVPAGVPRVVEAAVARALDKDPSARFNSMAEFAGALTEIPLARSRRESGRAGIYAVAAAGVLLLLVGGYVAIDMRRSREARPDFARPQQASLPANIETPNSITSERPTTASTTNRANTEAPIIATAPAAPPSAGSPASPTPQVSLAPSLPPVASLPTTAPASALPAPDTAPATSLQPAPAPVPAPPSTQASVTPAAPAEPERSFVPEPPHAGSAPLSDSWSTSTDAAAVRAAPVVRTPVAGLASRPPPAANGERAKEIRRKSISIN